MNTIDMSALSPRRQIMAFSACFLACALAACGGGGGGGSTTVPSTPPAVISGVVATGLVGNGTVNAYCTTNWAPNSALPASIGTAQTGTKTLTLGNQTYTMPTGAYQLTLTSTCADPILLLVTPPAIGQMLVADEHSQPPPASIVTVAASTTWSLRAYVGSVTASGTVTKNITPFTDMSAALVDQAVIFASQTLSSGVVAQADAAIVHTILGDDPQNAFSATPYDPLDPPTTSVTQGQQQLVTLLAAISLYAQDVKTLLGVNVTGTCEDPVACGGTGESALSRLEAPLNAAIGGTITATGYTRTGPDTASLPLPMAANANLPFPISAPDLIALNTSGMTVIEIPAILKWYVDHTASNDCATNGNYCSIVDAQTATNSGASALLQTSIGSVTAGN